MAVAVTMNLSEEELQLFLEELDEQVQVLEDGFMALEKGGFDTETLNGIFRAAHTVKGSSAAVGHQRMTALTHAMENLLDHMRKGELKPSRPLMDVLFKSLDGLRAMRGALNQGVEADLDLNQILTLLREAASPEEESVEEGRTTALAEALDEHVLGMFEKGVAAGAVPLKVRVSLAPDSIMPSVRAYQIFLALNEMGEVVSTRPTMDEVEAEAVEGELVIFLLATAPRETIRAAITAVTDVVKVDIGRVDIGTTAKALSAVAIAAEHGGGDVNGAPVRNGGPAGAGAGPGAGGGPAESRTIRVDVGILDNLMNLVGELVIDRTRLGRVSGQMSVVSGVEDLANEVGRISNHLARITGFMQDEVLKARMVPVDRLFKKFPRMVRDISQRCGKEVNFVMEGENTELDRALIEVLGDPLIHLLRNAADHGIEDPAEREKAGKPRQGTIHLSAYHRDNQIVVEVSDDGRGMNPERLKEVAVSKGVLTAERAAELSEREAFLLIFAPGFSTAKEVSDISGRGVGMDVVRRNIESVNGRVEIDSQSGRGTTIRIYLPLTLATIRALMVEAAGQSFALPLSTVVETLRVDPRQTQKANRQEVIVVREKVVPLRRLTSSLGMEGQGETGPKKGKHFYAVLVNDGGVTFGLVIDSLLGEQEIVIKSLGRFIGNLRGLSGATVLGDGSLALILDVRGLYGTIWENTAQPARVAG